MGFFRDVFLPGRVRPVKRSRRDLHVLHMESFHYNKDGKLLWHDPLRSNILHDEGELYILSAAFDTDLAGYGAPPASLYIGLDNRNTGGALAETDTLGMAGFAEPTGNGYARQGVSTATGFSLSAVAPYQQAQSATVTFAASGGSIGPVRNRFLCTVGSGTAGKLIASVPLSQSRTLASGDSLQTNIILQLD